MNEEDLASIDDELAFILERKETRASDLAPGEVIQDENIDPS